MGAVAGGVVLEEHITGQPGGPEAIEGGAVKGLRLGGANALGTFQDVGSRRDAAHRHLGRREAVGRRLADLIGLRHAAEPGFQSGRLDAGQAEGMGAPLAVEAEQGGTARGGAERADRRRRMPTGFVVAVPQKSADPCRDFDAAGERRQQGGPTRIGLFRQRQHGRQNRRCRMAPQGAEDVVKIEGVARDPVDQRRLGGGDLVSGR